MIVSSDKLTQSDLVSVVIPVYNSEKFLKESLDSVLEQTYRNIELIAIDDGSTDNSYNILERYSDKITVISQKNQGLTSALNVGVNAMNGKWFKWFSPDDMMLPNCIQELVDTAKTLDDNTIVYSNWQIIDEHGIVLRNFSEYDYNLLSKFDFNIRLLDGQQINVNTTIIPSKIFKNNFMFDELDDPVALDYDFFLRCALLNETCFYLLPKPLIKYRIHSEQLSRTNITKTLDYLENVKFQILSELSKETKLKYIQELKKYQKTKPLQKKTLEIGLKMLSKSPSWASDRILWMYLSKIRRSR